MSSYDGRRCCARPATSRRPTTTPAPRAAGADLAPLPVAARRGRRVQRAARGAAGAGRPVRGDRPARSVTGHPPAARVAAARGGSAAWAGLAPVLPDRAPHLLRPGVAGRARHSRRLRAAAGPRPRSPPGGSGRAGALPGGVRLGSAADARGRRGEPREILPWTVREVPRSGPDPSRDPRLAARPRGRPAARPRTGRPPGVAAAARRARDPRPADARPGRRSRAGAGVRAAGGTAGGLDPAPRHRRPAPRAAPRRPHRRPGRSRWSRRGRGRAPHRHEHRPAHPGRRRSR